MLLNTLDHRSDIRCPPVHPNRRRGNTTIYKTTRPAPLRVPSATDATDQRNCPRLMKQETKYPLRVASRPGAEAAAAVSAALRFPAATNCAVRLCHYTQIQGGGGR